MPLPVSGHRTGEWVPHKGRLRTRQAVVITPPFITDDDFVYGGALSERVYGVLDPASSQPAAIRTPFEILDRGGNRSPFLVPIRSDGVSIIEANGRPIREVWIGYVRSLCIADLLAAIPEACLLIDHINARADRPDMVRSVDTVAVCRLKQRVEVVSVIGLVFVAAEYAFDAVVGGRSFWTWAERFPERLPITDIMSFRIHDLYRCALSDHPSKRPAPPRHFEAPHPFRCAVLSYFPTHLWTDSRHAKRDGRRIPEVPFDADVVERMLVRSGALAYSRGRSAVIEQMGPLRELATFLREEPTFEDGLLLTRVEKGVPYLWMGSVEDRLGFLIDVGRVDPNSPPKHGSREGELHYYDVDSYEPTMLRRNHDGERGRSARTTAFVRLDGLREVLAHVRTQMMAKPKPRFDLITKLDRFAAVVPDDLEVYFLEKLAAASFRSPTDSGRSVTFKVVTDDGVVQEVVFDPVTLRPWLTYEQTMSALGLSLRAVKQIIRRLKAKDLVKPDHMRVCVNRGPSGSLRGITYLAWPLIFMMAPPSSALRHCALNNWVALARTAISSKSALRIMRLADL